MQRMPPPARWPYPSVGPFRIGLFNNVSNVMENRLQFTRRRGAVLHLRWEGVTAIDLNCEKWNKDSPFAFLVDTEMKHDGIHAMADDHELEATLEKLRRLAEETELKDLPAQVEEHSPRIRKMLGSRYTTRDAFRTVDAPSQHGTAGASWKWCHDKRVRIPPG